MGWGNVAQRGGGGGESRAVTGAQDGRSTPPRIPGALGKAGLPPAEGTGAGSPVTCPPLVGPAC